MSKNILLLCLLRSHINLSWKLILPHPSCFQAGVKSLERLKTCLHCDKHHEARLSALDAAPSNLSSIWKTAPVCWPRQSKANHFLPACQLLRSYQCHADGKTFRGWNQLPPKECSVKVKGSYVCLKVLSWKISIFVHQVVLFLPHCLQLLGREWQVNTDHGHLKRG